MPKNRLPAIVDRAEWEKVAKARAGKGEIKQLVEEVWKEIWGNQGEGKSARKFGKYKAELKERIERRERLALRNNMELGKDLMIYGGLRKVIGMKTYLHGPMDFAKTHKLRFRVGDLDLPGRRKRGQYTNSLEEEEIDAQVRPCGK